MNQPQFADFSAFSNQCEMTRKNEHAIETRAHNQSKLRLPLPRGRLTAELPAARAGPGPRAGSRRSQRPVLRGGLRGALRGGCQPPNSQDEARGHRRHHPSNLARLIAPVPKATGAELCEVQLRHHAQQRTLAAEGDGECAKRHRALHGGPPPFLHGVVVQCGGAASGGRRVGVEGVRSEPGQRRLDVLRRPVKGCQPVWPAHQSCDGVQRIGRRVIEQLLAGAAVSADVEGAAVGGLSGCRIVFLG